MYIHKSIIQFFNNVEYGLTSITWNNINNIVNNFILFNIFPFSFLFTFVSHQIILNAKRREKRRKKKNNLMLLLTVYCVYVHTKAQFKQNLLDIMRIIELKCL